MPEALTPQQASVKADSTVIVDPSTDGVLPCQPDGDGGTLCGIPVGYTGIYNRTGVYYLPKVRLILLFEWFRLARQATRASTVAPASTTCPR